MVYATCVSNSLFSSQHLNIKLAFGGTVYRLSVLFSPLPRPVFVFFSIVLPYSHLAILKRVIGLGLMGRRVAFCVTKYVRVCLCERQRHRQR